MGVWVSKKNVLIVAGSDSVGGAGVQADIKSCEAFSCFSASVITAVTAQNTNGVSSVLAMPANMVKAQFEMVLAELDIDAVKVGMLFNEEIIAVVSAFLKELRAKNVPVVIDPVCVAKSGAKLLEDGAIEALKELLNLASVATPNVDEARILGIDFANLPCDMVLKRTKVDEICEDTLYLKNGDAMKFSEELFEPRVMHGAGCSFSSSLAAILAQQSDLVSAIKMAKKFVANGIKNAHKSKFGTRLIDHKAGLNG
ncbi:hydroxymethylpyrimidine kinase / phosphohydroxymethylpyrimidine kinase [Campylobacter concisus 13826]|uniref:hydroxymethylpyrimidine kinase n=1 Tax=Campylobacter concisus (strain 13826) TaxID=360104 RepID=A7ZEN6_CAMC1|nr:hydroxymethylpyrimidine kinase / phosphohydroxymethylpyrimidine kinase [Campylobacter concisus 13826]